MRMMRSLLATAAAALVAASVAGAGVARAAGTHAPATASVKALSIVPGAGRAEVVIAVDGQVDVQDFVLANPHRIVLDLAGATLGAAPRLYDKVARGGITNIRLAQYREDVVRVVLDLDGPHEYQVVRGSADVRVAITGAAAGFTAWHSAAPEPARPARAAAAAPTAGRTALQHSMQRGIPSANPATTGSTQARITVTYQDADIRDVLAAFAAFSGRTIVVGRTVAGQITAEIRDQPWDVALQAILSSQGLAAAEDQYGIITVDSYQNILSKQASEPLVTQLVSINYARAASLVGTIQSLLAKDCAGGAAGAAAAGPGACITRGTVTADTGTNTLLITEVPSRIGDLIGYVKDLDVRTPQVAIKAKIIFVQRTDIEQMGVSYDLGSDAQFFNQLIQRIDPATGKPYDVAQYPSVISLGGDVVSGVANAKRSFSGTSALSLVFSTMLGKFSLSAFLDALQEIRLSDTQAEPSIVTLDNRPASILVGQETPIRVIDVGQGGGVQARSNVQFKESGIILQVTPHITNNRQILMQVHAEQSQLEAAAADLGYTFQKRRADNQLLVADGETAVIGGLTLTEVTASKSGIPFLVDLPLIGRLFGETSKQEVKRDLLILITPHIVDEGEAVGSSSGSER